MTLPWGSIPLDCIPVTETPYLDPETWGHYIGGVIITPNAKRLAWNVDGLGIDRTGKIMPLRHLTQAMRDVDAAYVDIGGES
jgi:hypothetical protein